MPPLRGSSKLRKSSAQSHRSTQDEEDSTHSEPHTSIDIDAIVKKTINTRLGNSGLEMLASLEVAKKETQGGFRPMKRRQSSAASRSTGTEQDMSQMIGVSAIVCVPTGCKKNGTLVSDKAQTPSQILNLAAMGLAARATAEKPLQFGKSWSYDKCEEWLRTHLPKPFAYAEEHNLQWYLLGREGRKLNKPIAIEINGQAFWELKSRVRGRIEDSRIYITFSKPIPVSIYSQWTAEESDSDEDIDNDSTNNKEQSESEQGERSDSEGSEWAGLGSAAYSSDVEVVNQDFNDTYPTAATAPSLSLATTKAGSDLTVAHKQVTLKGVPLKRRRALSNINGNTPGTKKSCKRRQLMMAQRKGQGKQEKENVNPTPSSKNEPLFLPGDSDIEPAVESVPLDTVEPSSTVQQATNPESNTPQPSLTVQQAVSPVPDIPQPLSLVQQVINPVPGVPQPQGITDPDLPGSIPNSQLQVEDIPSAGTNDIFVENDGSGFSWDTGNDGPNYESMFRIKGDRLYRDIWSSSYTTRKIDF